MSIDWDVHNPRRASYMAHNVLYDMAEDYYKKNKMRIFEDSWLNKSNLYFPKAAVARHKTLDGSCEYWFMENCGKMIQGFLNCYGYKDIGTAILSTKHYNELINQWDEWFEKKRKSFMDKQNNEIILSKGVPAKVPSSHGGVANLLKTLTKTMTMQGASIGSIAKVQYAVCKQAGIYIPSEFLTDVAVALDYNEAVERLEC